MYLRFTPFNLITMALMALTVWVGVSRFTSRLDSSWPLFYYLGVFAYLRAFEGGLNPYWVYVGVVAALLLRFEFIGGFFTKLVRAVELAFLAYLLWRGVELVMMW